MMSMYKRARAVGVALAFSISLLVAPSASAVTSSSAALPQAAGVQATDVPASGVRPGAVLSAHDASDLARLISPAAPRARVMSYATTQEDGTPVTATATVYEPQGAWLGKGSRPTVVVAPGTRGQGDQCAPSRAGLHVASAGQGAVGPWANIDYEYQTYQAALAVGMQVVVPDYIGLGTPGIHTYVNNIEQAHALLDATRATLSLTNQPGNAPVGFAGYSQGGGAAAAAAEYAASYAPELNVKGTYAGAPPADLEMVMRAVDGSSIVHVLGYALNGFIERDPSLADEVYPYLNARGREFLDTAKDSCIVDSSLKWGGTHTRSLTTTGQSLAEIAAAHPELTQELRRQKLGQHPITGPMLIANSTTDDLIPFAQAKALGGAYCAMGGTVELTAEPAFGLLKGTGFGHAAPFVGAVPKGLSYLYQRFNNVPAPSNCAGRWAD